MMKRATSDQAIRAYQQVSELQRRLVKILQDQWPDAESHTVPWLRDQGRCGGGHREVVESTSIQRASINVSQVQYEHLPEKNLRSATAISAIIHPASPKVPSLHLHCSWTEFRELEGYWRIMADLNPALPSPQMVQTFDEDLRVVTGEYYDFGKRQGEHYFWIPALDRHRGVVHFYLEGFRSEDDDFAFRFATQIMDSYAKIIAQHALLPFDEADREQQLVYHTLYFFQVLTLDRGTTSGILVHDENDEGILGSLPRWIRPRLLREWKPRVVEGTQPLVESLCQVFEDQQERAEVTPAVKRQCAAILRAFYREHPDQLQYQAQGFVQPQRGHR